MESDFVLEGDADKIFRFTPSDNSFRMVLGSLKPLVPLVLYSEVVPGEEVLRVTPEGKIIHSFPDDSEALKSLIRVLLRSFPNNGAGAVAELVR